MVKKFSRWLGSVGSPFRDLEPAFACLKWIRPRQWYVIPLLGSPMPPWANDTSNGDTHSSFSGRNCLISASAKTRSQRLSWRAVRKDIIRLIAFERQR